MTSRLTIDPSPKLLSLRRAGTAEIGLFWSPSTGQAAVAVEDAATGERFELVIQPGDNALDVFNHPYAYAAHA